MSNCSHKWVKYQPLLGEAYWCCALGECGITYKDFEKQQNESVKEDGFHIIWSDGQGEWVPADVGAGLPKGRGNVDPSSWPQEVPRDSKDAPILPGGKL